jgi:hypothetical protein
MCDWTSNLEDGLRLTSDYMMHLDVKDAKLGTVEAWGTWRIIRPTPTSNPSPLAVAAHSR